MCQDAPTVWWRVHSRSYPVLSHTHRTCWMSRFAVSRPCLNCCLMGKLTWVEGLVVIVHCVCGALDFALSAFVIWCSACLETDESNIWNGLHGHTSARCCVELLHDVIPDSRFIWRPVHIIGASNHASCYKLLWRLNQMVPEHFDLTKQSACNWNRPQDPRCSMHQEDGFWEHICCTCQQAFHNSAVARMWGMQ